MKNKLEVRNFCLMNEEYRQKAPNWAKPDGLKDPSGTTVIELPEDVILKGEYDEYNVFGMFENIPTYKDGMYSQGYYSIFKDGQPIGFAIPVDDSDIIEGIGFGR